MARWVKSKQSMRIFKTSTTPTALDGLTIGDIWIDTTSTAVEKLCTSISPVTFSTLASGTSSSIIGTTTNDDATAGNLGEFASQVVTFASPAAIGTGVPATICSLSLTAGDWNVWGNIGFYDATTLATVSTLVSNLHTTTNALANTEFRTVISYPAAGTIFAGGAVGFSTPQRRFSLASTTTIYLVAYGVFGVSATISTFGGIYARRTR